MAVEPQAVTPAPTTNGNGSPDASRKWRLSWRTWVAVTTFAPAVFGISTWLLCRGTITPELWRGTVELLGMWLIAMWGGIGVGYGALNISDKAQSGYVDVLKARAGQTP